eukprot:930436-Pyramimonas_sp.AAC.1
MAMDVAQLRLIMGDALSPINKQPGELNTALNTNMANISILDARLTAGIQLNTAAFDQVAEASRLTAIGWRKMICAGRAFRVLATTQRWTLKAWLPRIRALRDFRHSSPTTLSYKASLLNALHGLTRGQRMQGLQQALLAQ